MSRLESLPDELLLLIASFATSQSTIAALARTSHRLYSICDSCLYRWNVVNGQSWALDWAAEHENMVTFQKALDAGAPLPVEYSDEELTSRPVSFSSMELHDFRPHPLTLAARGGHETVIRFIIGKGASPDMIDSDGLTLLSVAAIYGHVSLTRALLALGAQQDIPFPGRRPLTLASYRGHKEVAAILLCDLENHYNTEALEDQVKQALLEAIRNRQKEIVQLLISHGAALNFFYSFGETPLNTAAKKGDTDILLLLLKHGADPDRVSNWRTGHAALTKAVLHNQKEAALILVQHTERLHCTRALSFAVQKDDTQMCESLLKKGAAPDFSLSDLAGHWEEYDLSHDWVQPIVYAVQSQDILLLDHGADVNVKCPGWPKTGYDVAYSHILFWSVEKQHEEIVDFLLERGADPNVVDSINRPPLSYAIQRGNEYIIKTLLDHGANPYRAVDRTGKRVLSYWEVGTSIRTMVEEAEKSWPGEP